MTEQIKKRSGFALFIAFIIAALINFIISVPLFGFFVNLRWIMGIALVATLVAMLICWDRARGKDRYNVQYHLTSQMAVSGLMQSIIGLILLNWNFLIFLGFLVFLISTVILIADYFSEPYDDRQIGFSYIIMLAITGAYNGFFYQRFLTDIIK